jgi:hypothetical protein
MLVPPLLAKVVASLSCLELDLLEVAPSMLVPLVLLAMLLLEVSTLDLVRLSWAILVLYLWLLVIPLAVLLALWH